MVLDNTYVTLIIPTFNEEKFIGRCLNSAFSQIYSAQLIEILVIDGESTDRTVAIVKQMQIDHNNLFLLNNQKKIQSSAFNLGVDNSHGEIIIRWDAHCLYDPEYIHFCVLNHREGKYGNVGGSIFVLPGSETLMAKSIASLNTSVFGLGGAAFRRVTERKLVKTVPFGAFRKSVISEVGKMNENLPRGEDNEYNSRILEAGYSIILDPKIISYYYSRSSLRSFLNQMYDNGFSVGVLSRLSLRYISIRHVIPLLFVLFLSFGSVISFQNHLARNIFLSGISLYVLLDLTSSLASALKKEIRIAPILLYSVFLVHLSYGIGTLVGLIRGRYKSVQNQC